MKRRGGSGVKSRPRIQILLAAHSPKEPHVSVDAVLDDSLRMLKSGAIPVPPPISSMGGASPKCGRYTNFPKGPSIASNELCMPSWNNRSVNSPPGRAAHAAPAARIMGRRGDGEAAAPSTRQQNIDVLAGLEAELFGNGQTQEQTMTSCDKGTARSMRQGKRFGVPASAARMSKSLDREVGARARLAQQDHALGDLGIGETERCSMG